MATSQSKPQTQPAAKSAAAAKTTKATAPKGNQIFLFDSTNYKWMIGGLLLILIGFALMAGGKSADPHQFLYDEIYSFRRITLAPIVMLIGFVMEVYAIMKKPAEQAK